MALSPAAIPLRDYRTYLDEYLRQVSAPFESVAGSIIEERLPAGYGRDPLLPCLVLWAGAACGADIAECVPVAAAFDLFDRFLLLHDELSAQAAPALERWGLGQSLNAGDALYALAFRHLAGAVRRPERRLAVAKLVAEAVLRAIECDADGGEASAVLTAAALQAGAALAGADERLLPDFAAAGRLLAAAAFAPDAATAREASAQAVAVLRGCAPGADLDALEEVAAYVARHAG